MSFINDPQFGDKMITLMAALVLVLQISMVGQRWLMTNIRIFALQSLLLAAIACTIAFFNQKGGQRVPRPGIVLGNQNAGRVAHARSPASEPSLRTGKRSTKVVPRPFVSNANSPP